MARAWMGALTASTIASAASATNATFLGRVSLSTVMLAFSLPRLGTATAPREIHPPDQRRRVHWVVDMVDEEPSPGLDTFSPPRRPRRRVTLLQDVLGTLSEGRCENVRPRHRRTAPAQRIALRARRRWPESRAEMRCWMGR